MSEIDNNNSNNNNNNSNNNSNNNNNKKRLGDDNIYDEHDGTLHKRLRDDNSTNIETNININTINSSNNNNNTNSNTNDNNNDHNNSDLILSGSTSHIIHPHHILAHHPHPHHIIEQSAEELQVETTIEPGYKTGPWIYEEDERLIQAVGVFKKPDGNVNWGEVTRFITDRSQKQCYVRWNTLLKYRGMGTRRGAWTPEEDQRLTEAVARHERKGGGIYWGKVSEEMGGDRTYQQCLKRWKQVLQHVGSGAKTGAWTEQEDARLVEAMALYDGQGKGGGVDWTKVSEYLGGQRAPTQCYKRWHDALKQRRKSLHGEDWTLEEDYAIIQAVSIYAGEGLGGGVDWNAVSDYLQGTKSAKQCNKRWNRVLKIREGVEGRIRTDPWEPEEERLLYLGVETCRIHLDSNLDPQQQQQQLQYGISNQSISTSSSLPLSPSTTTGNNNSNNNTNSDLQSNSSSNSNLVPESDSLPNSSSTSSTTTTTTTGIGTTGTQVSNNPGNDSSIIYHDQDHHHHQLQQQQQQQQLYQQHQHQSGNFQRYPDLPSGQHVSYHHLYPTQNELAPGEIHLRSVDWVRVSTEFLQGHRTPRQCEKRFEGLQRQRFRENHYDEGYQQQQQQQLQHQQESNISVDTSMVDDDDENRRNSSLSNMSSVMYSNTPSRDDRRSSVGSASSYYRHRGRAIKTGPWLPEEDERLIEAVSLYEGQGRGGAVDWGRVCEYMGGDRTYDQCRVRWNGVLKVFKNRGTVVKTGPWAKVEDEKLVEAVGIFEGQGKGGGVDWTKVSEYLHGERTPNQCHTRWNSVLKHRGLAMKTTPWTDIEDIKLAEAVGMYDGMGRGGTVDWSKVSEHMGGERSSYQHRMRWHSVLKHRVAGAASRPTGKKDVVVEPWNNREIQILLNAVEICAKENPIENADITEDSEYSLHNVVHQSDSSLDQQQNQHQNQHQHQQIHNDESSGVQMKDITLESFDVPTGPVAAAAQSGALIAHTINWIAVSNRLAEEYSLIGGVGIKRSPLQCLHMWRQFMNSRMKFPIQNSSDISTVEIDDARMIPGNSFVIARNSPWTDMEDEKLTEAVGVYDGQGRGGGVDWAKVCEFMGSIRTYNQCRHRWHNVIKHRGISHDNINPRLSSSSVGVGGGDDGDYSNYVQNQDHDVSVDLSHNQDWSSHQQQLALHRQMMEHQHQQGEVEGEDSHLYQTLQKYGV